MKIYIRSTCDMVLKSVDKAKTYKISDQNQFAVKIYR